MRFVIIYHNRDDVRANIESLIPQAVAQGINFALSPFDHPIFHSEPFWLKQNVINSLPLNMQCEEVEWKDGKLVSIKKLVVDIEPEITTVVEVKKESN